MELNPINVSLSFNLPLTLSITSFSTVIMAPLQSFMVVSADELDFDTMIRDFKGLRTAERKQKVSRDESCSDSGREL